MPIQLKSIYVGPNVYLPVAAIRWTYQHGGVQFRPGLAPALAFAAPLFALLPTLEARLKAAPSPGELLMQANMALQAVAPHPAALAKVVPAGVGQAVAIVCPSQEVEETTKTNSE